MDKDGGGFQGYCPDLLKLMRERFSHEFSFNYQLRLVGDGKYGAEGPDKKWNGMIGELMRNVRTCPYMFIQYKTMSMSTKCLCIMRPSSCSYNTTFRS